MANHSLSPAPSPHSKAPWLSRWNEDSQCTEIYSEQDDLIVAVMYDPSDEWLETHTEWDEEKMQEVRESVQSNVDVMTAAPELLELVRSFRNSCKDRINALEEEKRDAAGDESVMGYFNEQLAHWQYSLDRCEAALRNWPRS